MNNGQIVKHADSAKVVAHTLTAMRDQIVAALPRTGLTPERLTRLVVTEVKKTPLLAQCTPASFYGSIMQSAQLGLEIGSHLGHAFLIPYKRRGEYECQLITGYKGLVALARRSGDVLDIFPQTVREGDEFKVILGTNRSLVHVPVFGSTEAPIGFYAVAVLKNGERPFVAMSVAEVNTIRDASPGAGRSDSPWQAFYEAMAWKTVLRRLCKFLPSSLDLERAVSLDEAAEAAVPQTFDVEFRIPDPSEQHPPEIPEDAEPPGREPGEDDEPWEGLG